MYSKDIISRFHESYQPVPESGCWLWDKATWGRGYGSFFVTKKRPRPWNDKAHRASWVIHNGPIPDGMHVLHKCDVPCCVNPDHLMLGTNADNINDRLSKNRPKTGVRGESNHLSKLTAQQAKEIHRRLVSGERGTKIAAEFGISTGAVYAIKHGRSWNECCGGGARPEPAIQAAG